MSGNKTLTSPFALLPRLGRQGIAALVIGTLGVTEAQIIEGRSVTVISGGVNQRAEPLEFAGTRRARMRDLTKTSEEQHSSTRIPKPAYLLQRPTNSLPQGAGTFDGLPTCMRRGTRLASVPKHELINEKFDLVIYQHEDRDQKRKARQLGTKTVSYLEGDALNPFRDRSDLTQAMLRELSLQCLPTRVRVITRNNRPQMEYREGEAAFSVLGH